MELNYDDEFKREAIEIFYEGNSGRAVGRIKGINKSTVYNSIKKLNAKTAIVKKEIKYVNQKWQKKFKSTRFFPISRIKKQSIRNNIGNKKFTTNSRL